MAKREGLCEDCARREIDQAFACLDRERAAKKAGQSFVCTCPLIVCEHKSTPHKRPDTEGSNG